VTAAGQNIHSHSEGPPLTTQQQTTSEVDSPNRRAIVAACAGTFVEFFDFTTYGVFAAVIAAQFFPNQSGLTALLATFAVFGVSYLLRPLGAIVFGHYGDKLGRRNVLAISIITMSGSTFLIGAVPVYAQIGLAAPIILVILRSLQGFSAGGEWGGATTFLAEYAPQGRRGFLCGLNIFATVLGVLFGVVLGGTLSLVMSPDALHAWGWRIPFLLALPLGLVGLYFRRKLDETPEFKRARATDSVDKTPLRTAVRQYRRQLLVVVGLTALGTSGMYLLLFMPTYMSKVLHYTFSESLIAVGAAFGACACTILVASAASDRMGRRMVMLVGSVLSVVTVVPAFWLVQQSFTSALSGSIALGAAIGVFCGPFPAAIAELFPTAIRFSGLSLGYGVATSVFGGMTPLAVTFLLERTHNAMAPAYFFVVAAIITLTATIFYKESRERKVATAAVV